MERGADIGSAHLRVARSTDDLAALVHFYQDGLGLDVLFEFREHNGFDGVMESSCGHETNRDGPSTLDRRAKE